MSVNEISAQNSVSQNWKIATRDGAVNASEAAHIVAAVLEDGYVTANGAADVFEIKGTFFVSCGSS